MTAMGRRPHPDKEIENALRHAEAHGWTVELGGSHCWGRMYCPENAKCRGGTFCMASIWSTPKNAGNFARQLCRVVDNCTAGEDERSNQERTDGV